MGFLKIFKPKQDLTTQTFTHEEVKELLENQKLEIQNNIKELQDNLKTGRILELEEKIKELQQDKEFLQDQLKTKVDLLPNKRKKNDLSPTLEKIYNSYLKLEVKTFEELMKVTKTPKASLITYISRIRERGKEIEFEDNKNNS